MELLTCIDLPNIDIPNNKRNCSMWGHLWSTSLNMCSLVTYMLMCCFKHIGVVELCWLAFFILLDNVPWSGNCWAFIKFVKGNWTILHVTSALHAGILIIYIGVCHWLFFHYWHLKVDEVIFHSIHWKFWSKTDIDHHWLWSFVCVFEK